MKIGMVHLNLSTESGDPRMFYSIARELRAIGHTVKIYTSQYIPTAFADIHEGLDIVVVPPSAPLGAAPDEEPGVVSKIRGRMRSIRIAEAAADAIGGALDPDLDVLIAQNDPSYRLGVGYKRAHPRAKFVWIMNNAPFYHAPKPDALTNLLSWAAGMVARVRLARFTKAMDLVVVHDTERRDMLAPFRVRTALLRIPVDAKGFEAPVHERKPGEKRAALIGVGSLSPPRRYEDIIAAAASLRDRGYDARAVLVCKDFWNDSVYRASLISLTKQLHMEDRVDFRFKGVDDDELRRLLKASDIYVFPNIINIWSMSSFEAMAAGLLLIASRATSLPEVLTDGAQALFSEPGRADDIAAKADTVLKDPLRYRQIASAGQKFVRENLNWRKYAEDLVSEIAPRSQ